MVICAACGQENPEGFRFCGACAAPLAEAPAPREQRKTVTLLFCDVAGSTSLGERLDPETLPRVMRRYFDEIEAVVVRHGGTVEKFVGGRRDGGLRHPARARGRCAAGRPSCCRDP